MKKTKNTGITLIALIITIIVLLILAGVSISMVVGDNGVLGQAINATTATDVADTKEQIELEIIGKLDDSGDYTVKDVLEVAKEITGNDVDMENKTVETAKGNTVDISDILDGAVASWWYEDDENVTNGSVTLAIGDTVYYNAVTGATETSYTSYTTETGYTDDQTFTLTSDDDYDWQVMGVDEDTGELLIVLSDIITTSDGEDYYLSYFYGYMNCENELNNICNLFGQGYKSTGARSITVEDINKLTGYDPTDIDGEGTSYGSGYVYEYGNEVTYTMNDSGYVCYQGSKYPLDMTESGQMGLIVYENGIELSVSYSTFVSDFYAYDISDAGDVAVCSNNESYWCGNSCITCMTGYVGYGVRIVSSDRVTADNLWRSNSRVYVCSSGVRPVVSLSSDVTFSGDSASGWSIE